jgi:hypothetical protein
MGKPSKLGYGSYWQSSRINRVLYACFLTQAENVALSRFKWLGLPPTCDERWLERCLLFERQATIAFPANMPGTFFSTKCAQSGSLNVYGNPTKWRSVGNDGWSFEVNNANGVMVYDNLNRTPTLNQIEVLCRELVDCFRTKQINRMQQRSPYIIKGPRNKKFDLTQVIKQLFGGEPAIVGYQNMMDDISIEAIDTQVPYLGEQLQEDYENIWNQIYLLLGIRNLPYKSERRIESEVRTQNEPSDFNRLSSLMARRQACDQLNRRFGQYLAEPVRVVWNADNESENHDLATNVAKAAEAFDMKLDLAKAGEEDAV